MVLVIGQTPKEVFYSVFLTDRRLSLSVFELLPIKEEKPFLHPIKRTMLSSVGEVASQREVCISQ